MSVPEHSDYKKEEKRENDKNGKLEEMVGSFASASNTTRVMVISGLLVAGFTIYWVVFKGADKTENTRGEDEETKEKKRVRFVEPDEQEALDWARQEEQREHDAILGAINSNVQELNTVAREMMQVDGELRTTNESLQKLNGDDKEGHDTELSSFESDQSLEKAFMSKDDIDKKRKGLLDLSKELGLHRQYLQQRHDAALSKAKQFDHQYRSRYNKAPDVRKPLSPT